MRNAYVIQIGGRTAGIVARDGADRSYNFFAASHAFNAMEGLHFDDPAAAERMARHLARHGGLPRRTTAEPPAAPRRDAAAAAV
ncbi:hypothetical protein [Methylocella sp.]|uniref:hypothetical protein n=1 Tax=Methylocella sp. TaxID=1978226 RepID=UPI0035AE59CA